jgi:hypothetical protein
MQLLALVSICNDGSCAKLGTFSPRPNLFLNVLFVRLLFFGRTVAKHFGMNQSQIQKPRLSSAPALTAGRAAMAPVLCPFMLAYA